MLMLPALVFSRFFHQPKDWNKPTSMERVFVWCVVLYGAMGFIIPAIVGLTVDLPNQAFYMSTIFGPFVLTAILIGIVIRFANERFGRVGAKPPRGFMTFFIVLCWAYLLSMEAMLMVAARGTGLFSGAGTILAAFVGYLPIRLVLVIDDDMPPLELASFAVGFCHFLYRLGSAKS